jgi:Protein of unknown function (DUF1573)
MLRGTCNGGRAAWAVAHGNGVLLSLAAIYLMTMQGCYRRGATSSEPQGPVLAQSMFLGTGEPLQCSGKCVPTAVAFARAELGLDPGESHKQDEHAAEDIFTSLEKGGMEVGSRITRVPVGEVLEKLVDGPASPVVLVHVSGHLYVLFGAIRVNDSLLCQVVHGNEAISLVAKHTLLESGFREAWCIEQKQGVGVPIHVGSALVEMNKLWHNFGEVFLDQPLTCAFRIKNIGDRSVILDKPVVSCTCTVPNLTDKVTLAPAQILDLEVQSASPGTTSLRNAIGLSFFDKGNGASRRVPLSLIGSRRVSMEVVPQQLDFGLMVPDKPVSRTVSLVEKPSDRFVLTKVDPGKLPILHEIDVARGRDGLATYKVHLKLSIDGKTSGAQRGEVALTTDSHTRPRITIPVTFQAARPVRAFPSVLSLGTIAPGEAHQSQVEFISRYGEPLDIHVGSHPEECTITVDRTVTPARITVATTLKTQGIWQGVIKVKVGTPSGEESIEIKCVGYGRNAI